MPRADAAKDVRRTKRSVVCVADVDVSELGVPEGSRGCRSRRETVGRSRSTAPETIISIELRRVTSARIQE